MAKSPTARFDVIPFLTANWLALSLTAIMGVLIIIMSMMLMNQTLSQREIGLITFILTAASSVASFLGTKMYGESASSKTLRDHGVQIASGIMVLRRQIDALAEWVDDKRGQTQRPGAGTHPDSVLEHVEETLAGFRQMTDAALGGIGGVIGDALAQYEAVMNQISNTRAEALRKTTQIEREMEKAQSTTEVARLEAQIEEIASTTEKRIAQLARSSALPIPTQATRRLISVQCPMCAAEHSFEIVDRVGETRVRACPSCGERFNVHIAAGRVLTRPHGIAASGAAVAIRGSDNATGEVRGYIKDAFIEPALLAKLISVAVALDARARLRGTEMTPARLQEAALSAPELENVGISRSRIRHFFFACYRSRAFRFETGGIGFYNPYRNPLTEDDLLAGC